MHLRIYQPVKVCISITDSATGTGKIWTDKYKDAIHVLLQIFNADFVVTLRFFTVKRPELISIVVEIPYHAGFCARIIWDRTFARVVNTDYCHDGGVRGLHTGIRVYHVSCMSVGVRLNLAVS